MIRPPEVGGFQFAVLSSLRVAQLMRGSVARVGGAHKNTIIAQMEVAQGKVSAVVDPVKPPVVAK